jgi:glycolate oxidase
MNALASDLGRLLSRERVRTDPEDLYAYSSDATYYFVRGNPDAVVLPENAGEVSKVVKYAAKNRIPVTPRGAGTGLSSGCTPIHGGIVIDTKRMNRIIEINRGNMTGTVECGVVLGNFQKAVERENLFYPPDPQSWEVSTLGGNVSTRAGGPRGVKYGTTPHYVLGLELVLPDGEIINTGGTCVKSSVGYDLTHLL